MGRIGRLHRVELVAGATLVLGELVWLLLALPRAALVSDVVAVVVAGWAALRSLGAARQADTNPRRFWLLVAVTMGLAVFGRLLWIVLRLTNWAELPNNPLVGAIFLGSLLTGTAAILACVSAPRSAAARARTVLDGIIIGLALVPVGWLIVLQDVVAAPLADPIRTLGLLYPSLDLMQLTVVVAVSGRSRLVWPPLAIIGAGIAVRAVADTLYVSQVARGEYFAGHPTDVLWPLSYLLVVVAAWYRAPGAADPVDEIAEPPAGPSWRVVLPYLPVGPAIVAGVLARDSSGHTPSLILWTGAGLLASLAIRQGLAAYEHSHLAVRLRQLAYEDQLTGLPNRLQFSRLLRRAIRDEDPVALLLLDLDGFKQINDRFGHAAGDQLLTTVADRMRTAVGPDGIIARLGGDEFAVLLSRARARSPEELAQRLLVALRAAERDDELGMHSSASIGIAEYGPHHTGHADLLRDADIAMYAAKAAGKSGFRRCTPALREAAVTRAELIADLRRAVDDGELDLEYQPIVDLTTGTMRSVEALVRWRHPRRGLIPPGQFLPLAEETGLILPIDRWVLGEACRAAATWQDVAPLMTVAVNIASMHLRRPDITATVAAATARAGLSPDVLTLELTETALIDGTDEVLRRLRQLRDLGVRIAIDDFGTGYSSLSYLHRIPASELKIDRSFVARLGGSSQAYATVDMVTRLAGAFGLIVVAEGVENRTQHGAISAIGCPRAQGYLYGRPSPLPALRASIGARCPVPGGGNR